MVFFSVLRDNEHAYVSVNHKICWSVTAVGTSGTQECGRIDKEERFRVTDCYVIVEANTPLTVRVWTSLGQDASDESFGIGNVVIRPLAKGHPGRIGAHGRQP